jgi:hypothetical protein
MCDYASAEGDVDATACGRLSGGGGGWVLVRPERDPKETYSRPKRDRIATSGI